IVKLDLKRMYAALKLLDNPHLKLPPVIHCAGTNGKGSTLAFLQSILEKANYSVHKYVSPHLINFNERIILNGEEIKDDYLFEILEECRIKVDEHIANITFFEGVTLAAMIAFSRIKADFVLLEVGLGGILDATNVIPNPLIVILTSISFDHTDFLGNAIELIAQNKCGIIKENCSIIGAKQEFPIVHQIIEAHRKNNIRYSFGLDWDIIYDENEDFFTYIDQNKKINLPLPNLLGEHQIYNAVTAIAASVVINNYINDNNIKNNKLITINNIIDGITSAKWNGRLQKIKINHFNQIFSPSHYQIIFDGAHNAGGAKVLADYLKKQKNKSILIIGMTKNKDIEEFIKILLPYIEDIYTVCVNSEPLAMHSNILSEKIIEVIKNNDYQINCYDSDNIENAFNTINKNCNFIDNDIKNIIITGSLFLFSDLMKYL
ncbi:MAG: bifunctional folylpolyglutamate synthase/dihydrofolate synthase, partial [Anaplasmataceae bacterium]|nr:bifunctional folylpolyglutamate synthase/dihydrofolate synthase [Anaplasmataceae bacterium]